MGIPKQVEEAAKMAETLHGKMYPQEGTEIVEETSDKAAEEEEEDKGTVDNETPEVKEKQEEEEQKAPVVEEEETYEEKYNKLMQTHSTLRGKYDAEVPRLHTELKEMKENIFGKIDQVLAEKAPESKETVTETPQENEKIAKFREEFGNEYVDNILELLRSEVNPLLDSKLKPVSEKVEAVETTQTEYDQKSFTSALDQAVKGDWRKAWNGEDPAFNDFLKQTDPGGFSTYQENMERANESWDSEKMAKVFNLYYEQQKPAPKTDPPAPTGEEAEEIKRNKAEKEALIAPNRSPKVETPKPEDEKVIWTQADIKQFQIDDRKNKFSPEVSTAKWNDLLAALGEGRIVP